MAGHIEEGWRSYRNKVVPKDAPPVQVRETRLAFYAGVAHLLETLLTRLAPGREPTDADFKMMDDIHQEVDAFIRQLGRRNN